MALSKPIDSGVYVILCSCSKSAYIGESNHLAQRKSQHLSPNRPHGNINLRADIAAYGLHSFDFRVLERIRGKQARLASEKKWFDHYTNLGYTMYNLKAGGRKAGMFLAPSVRANLAAALQGSKHSDDTKQKIGDSLRGKKRKRSAVAKTAKAHRGKTVSPTTRSKISNANKGKVLSASTRKKMSDAKKGNKSKTGIAAAKAACAKASASMKAYWERRKATEALADEILSE